MHLPAVGQELQGLHLTGHVTVMAAAAAAAGPAARGEHQAASRLVAPVLANSHITGMANRTLAPRKALSTIAVSPRRPPAARAATVQNQPQGQGQEELLQAQADEDMHEDVMRASRLLQVYQQLSGPVDMHMHIQHGEVLQQVQQGHRGHTAAGMTASAAGRHHLSSDAHRGMHGEAMCMLPSCHSAARIRRQL